jgi:hypothetical protein
VTGSFLVVGVRAEAVLPMTTAGYRLVLFDQRENAETFARGLLGSGFHEAHVGSLDNAELAALLDKRDAPEPLTFETTYAPWQTDDVERATAYALGAWLGHLWLGSLGMAN